METALSTISVFPENLQELQHFTCKLKDEILACDDPLKVLVRLKYLEKLLENVLKDKDLDDLFISEAEQYSAKERIIVSGAELAVRETGVKYDYAASGDSTWAILEAQINELSEKKREREKYLQYLPVEGAVDASTGEFIRRPPRTSKTKVVVTIK